MARSYKIYDEHFPYFITTGITFGLPLFNDPAVTNTILENLAFMRNKGKIRLTAFVIMENHIHLILQGEDLAAKISRFKSYSARRIIDFLKSRRRSRWLKRLKAVKSPYKTDREYQLWEESFHPKQIVGDKMMLQKIEYIHQNPVNRGYVDKPEHWRYSSARNYAGMESLITVDRFNGRAG